MNYRIIGTDGKTYGPVSAEQLRRWLAQGRVDKRTAVYADGAADWTFLGLLPEFAREFSGPPPVIAPPTTGSAPVLKTNGYATAGLICGILSWACCCGCPFNILGLVFSLVALAQINAAVEPQAGRGLAIAGLVCSAVSLLFSSGLGMLQLLMTPANFSWHFGRF